MFKLREKLAPIFLLFFFVFFSRCLLCFISPPLLPYSTNITKFKARFGYSLLLVFPPCVSFVVDDPAGGAAQQTNTALWVCHTFPVITLHTITLNTE
jgi:hypothetical protein